LSKIRTFEDIVRQAFYGEIENRVFLYVERNFADMEFKSFIVDKVDEAHVQDTDLHRVVAYDIIGDTLPFDAIVVAEISIDQIDRHYDLEDSVRMWFRVSCEVDITDGFGNFRIIDVDDEYDHNVNTQSDTLDDALIPVISAANIERHAEKILRYVYPEALNTPMRVNVERFAERLGLQIVRKHLSRNGSIFGQMIFHPTKVDYYDLDKRGFSTYDADGGTIFADDEIFFLHNLGSWNNTIIHECVHWLKHRKHIELKRAAGRDVSRIACQVAEVPPETKNRKRTDTEWVEWHANALAPRILMPRKPFKQKADELIAWHKGNNRTNKLSDVIGAVITELSDFFGVSLLSAKIRMVDIGYTEAIGAFEYVDGQYKPVHAFKAGAISEKQTFTIPVKEGLAQYTANTVFRAVIDTGGFVYIDGHYVINAPKYVVANEHGILMMTDYALAHMDECCLSFERVTRSNPNYSAKRYAELILYQSATNKHITEVVFRQTDNDKKVAEQVAAIKKELEEAKSAGMLMADLPGSFGKSLTMIMERLNVTVEKLAELALLDPKMIQRMRNDQDRAWNIKKLTALCIGLCLPPDMSLSLISKAGLNFKHSEEHIVMKYILMTRFNSTIHECNEVMEVAGFPPLSDD